MRSHGIIGLSVLAAVCASAAGQSINFDYSTNFSQGPWHNAPADTWGGAHGQTGHWIHSQAFISWNNLAGLNGAPTLADLTVSGGSNVNFLDHSVLNGDIEVMMGDWMNADPGDPITLTFTSLFPGVYTVYTYSNNLWCPACRSTVNVTGSPDGAQIIGGEITTNAPTQGVTHAKHRVFANLGTITVQISAQTTFGSFNGIQLVFHGRVAPRLYVDPDTTGTTGGGTSWGQACFRLDDALTVAAMADGDVEEIWVAEGVFRPTRNGNRGDSFVIPDGVKVYGGFAGTETQLEQRDVSANLCTLSGAINSPLISSDNCRHVVDMSDTSAGTLLDGFTISNGYASGLGTDGYGGGIHMNNSSAAVRRCRIINNHGEIGGGVWSSGDSPDFVDCSFINNDSDSVGGGARVLSGAQTATFMNCRFLGNDAAGGGGGASVNGQKAWFVNCVFSGNHATAEGGALHANGEEADILVVNSTLSSNDSDAACGGIYMAGGADDDVANSILWANTDSDPITNTRQAQYFAFDGTSVQDLNYTIVQGWNIVAGVGNNGLNPLFIDANGTDNVVGTADDDLHVQTGSPAIDSGRNSDLPLDISDLDDDGVLLEFLPWDLDGLTRRMDDPSATDTGSGTAPLVDRGPFERQPPSCLADIAPVGSPNGLVNVDDLLAVINAWGPCANPNACPPDIAPLGGNDIVNVDDLLAVINGWGSCP